MKFDLMSCPIIQGIKLIGLVSATATTNNVNPLNYLHRFLQVDLIVVTVSMRYLT